jgi:hypothetical protein
VHTRTRLPDGRVAPGRGPAPGAANAGRPPSAIAAACRRSFEERIHIAEAIADDPASTAMERLKALDLLAKYGGLTRLEIAGTDSESPRPRQCMIIGGKTIWFD